jgi:carbon-monoxide dehydrogenase small subunit
MVMSTLDLLNRNPQPERQEIIEGISGNLCRCTGYKKIISGIELAAQRIGAANTAEEGGV